MSEKSKIFLIYLILGMAPVVAYLFHLGPVIASHNALSDLLVFVPYVGLILLGVAGWLLNQTRVFWSCLLILTVYNFLLTSKLFSLFGINRNATLEIMSVSLPLSLSLLFAVKESRLWSQNSAGRLLFALSPFFLFTAFQLWDAADLGKLFFWNLGPLTHAFQFPHLAWVSAAVLGLTAFRSKDQKANAFLMALFASLIPILFSLHFKLTPHVPPAPTPSNVPVILAYTAVTIIFLHAIFSMYWKRVYMDALTGIPNRQSLDERLHNLTGEFAAAMVDVDHFKKFNDEYGHHEGDNVLRMVATHLRNHFGDHAYRYGGEEFCIIFEGIPLEQAEKQADEARKELEETTFILRGHLRRKNEDGKKNRAKGGGKKVQITVSIGVANSNAHIQSNDEVVKKADKALYQAKDKGRNRVVAL